MPHFLLVQHGRDAVVLQVASQQCRDLHAQRARVAPGRRARSNLRSASARRGGQRLACATSRSSIWRSPGVSGCSGSLYSLSVRAMVIRGARRLRQAGGRTPASPRAAQPH